MQHASSPRSSPPLRCPPLASTAPLPPAACRQFMVGPHLLVSPVLQQGATSVRAYFPPGTWHSLWDTGEVVEAG